MLSKLWNASPKSVARAIKRRLELRRPSVGWATVQAGPLAGVQMLLPSGGRESGRPMAEGTFDRFLYNALLERVSPRGLTVWDIGAHFGYHSFCFAKLGAQVLAFEPNATNVSQFRLNLERNPALAGRIRLLELAVSDTDGRTTFLESNDLRGQSSGSHLETALPPLDKKLYAGFESKSVPTSRMDTLISETKERPPDVIKVDVEGAELLVLKGGSNFLPARKPILLMEIHHIRLMFQIGQLLASWGYETRLLEEPESSASRCFIMAGPTDG